MRTLAALLIVAAALPADEIVASFRIKSEPRTPMRGYLADWNDADFRFRAFGVAGRSTLAGGGQGTAGA